ncbi:hypothetical protein BpHYR1_012808 [Brachionus plicatilis]|uniref:Uncharacterized protein n=1 Tax=Brachionus plicatilis TaxID=10195 RepID=A0A3M7RYJ4_BRAPC|nr:hypothetical protein BpHYR1_012808 [Brachionus plicatilis]
MLMSVLEHVQLLMQMLLSKKMKERKSVEDQKLNYSSPSLLSYIVFIPITIEIAHQNPISNYKF